MNWFSSTTVDGREIVTLLDSEREFGFYERRQGSQFIVPSQRGRRARYFTDETEVRQDVIQTAMAGALRDLENLAGELGKCSTRDSVPQA